MREAPEILPFPSLGPAVGFPSSCSSLPVMTHSMTRGANKSVGCDLLDCMSSHDDVTTFKRRLCLVKYQAFNSAPARDSFSAMQLSKIRNVGSSAGKETAVMQYKQIHVFRIDQMFPISDKEITLPGAAWSQAVPKYKAPHMQHLTEEK